METKFKKATAKIEKLDNILRGSKVGIKSIDDRGNIHFYETADFVPRIMYNKITQLQGERVNVLIGKDYATYCNSEWTPTTYKLKLSWLCDIEYVTDWNDVEVDTPILVRSDYREAWYHRYFAKYENGKVYAYNDGCTSWSAMGGFVSHWEEAKLYENNI